jgi:putative endonuclease
MAVLALRLKGYRILARRYRSAVGEIDIVARRGGVVAMVEVKARPDRAAGLEALGPMQRSRLTRAAASLLASRPLWMANATIRFDLILVRPWRWPTHLPDAWRPEGEAF